MLDEDPVFNPRSYLDRMQVAEELGYLGLRLMEHQGHDNRVVIIRPRLEDWLIRAARDAGLRLDDRRYALPTNASRLHEEITRDLRKLDRLLGDLLSAHSPRILRLKTLLTD